jgi:hypothetical protein
MQCGKIIPYKQAIVFALVFEIETIFTRLTPKLPSPISSHETAARKGRRFVIGDESRQSKQQETPFLPIAGGKVRT